jgi:thiamine-phosphate pyrophosphorylase
MFPTRTKSVPCGALGLEKIEELKSEVSCPFSVMGGIKEHHLELLCAKGFRHIAMVTEITMAFDVETKVRQLRSIMQGGRHE